MHFFQPIDEIYQTALTPPENGGGMDGREANGVQGGQSGPGEGNQPGLPQNVIDLQHWYGLLILIWSFTDPEPVGYAFPDPDTGRRLGLIPG